MWLSTPGVLFNQVFEESIALRLNNGAFDLAFDQLRIDRMANVIDANHFDQPDLPGIRVYLHLGRFCHISISKIRLGFAGFRVKGRRFCGRYLKVAEAGLSSFFHFCKASSAAPLIEFPAIKVMREADALPESPVSKVSETTRWTLSNGYAALRQPSG